MKHAREDYQRFQDPENKIPEDEPVFIVRGQDICAPDTLEFWARQAALRGASEKIVDLVMQQAEDMREWQRTKKSKIPDLPGDKKNVLE